ncbi:MAG: DUF1330 domain-containing protein [Beijerinckiaceae bacterium]|nr:DUF1330 domain-containing protein [Beijerinckiaceae bacterium]
MKGYWIARFDVADPEAHKRYAEAAKPAFEAAGAKFLARGGAAFAAEGQARARNVVIEFPSYQAAVDCYNSPVYRNAAKHREGLSIGEIVIVEGL